MRQPAATLHRQTRKKCPHQPGLAPLTATAWSDISLCSAQPSPEIQTQVQAASSPHGPTSARPAVGGVQQDVSPASLGGSTCIQIHHDGPCAGSEAALAQ